MIGATVKVVELTQKQKQVVDMVARDMRTRDIALQLGKSERAVEALLTRVYRRMGVRSRVGAVTAMRDTILNVRDTEY